MRDIKSYRLLIATGLFLISCSVWSQQKTPLQFRLLFSDSDLKLNTKLLQPKSDDTLIIETLKFYISEIEFLSGSNPVWKEKVSHHLVDLENETTLRINLDVPNNLTYDRIKFNLGIDSATNASGAMGGDLDPTKSMYWTWHSGYINAKIEGRSKVCKTRNNEFQFHLGGYLAPNSCLNTIIIHAHPNQAIVLAIDFATWFLGINLANQNHIMSPGPQAVKLSQKLSDCFTGQKK